MDWKRNSKYYITWDEYLESHPDIDEKNAEAMRPRFEAYQEYMFNMVLTFLF